MGQIALVRSALVLDDAIYAKAIAVILACADGMTESDRIGWRKFFAWLERKQAGEIAHVEVWFPRHGRFHRLHMAMEAAVFDAQERIADFDQFRAWVKIGAGWVDWMPSPNGGIVPIPKSISYRAADEQQYADYHLRVLAFLRGPHAAPFLWKHLKGNDCHDMMASILEGFEQ
jgi:hypothetical protein